MDTALLNQPETKWSKLALRFISPGGTAIFKGHMSSKTFYVESYLTF